MSSITNHLLSTANYIPSAHFDERSDEKDISLLVIHNISLPPSQFGGTFIEQFFQGDLDWNAHPYFKTIEGIRVSSHLLIKRDGQVIQFVPFNKRAWHAGISNYKGREACNDFSIGIELEGVDDIPFTSIQYQSLIQVTNQLIEHYPLMDSNHITGHSDIAPGRKTDPGQYFDWHYYKQGLNAC